MRLRSIKSRAVTRQVAGTFFVALALAFSASPASPANAATSSSLTPEALVPGSSILAVNDSGASIPVKIGINGQFYGPDGIPLGRDVVIYQNGMLRLEEQRTPKPQIRLADGFTNDVPRNSSAGSVTIPEGYVYDPSLPKPRLHDYCSLSPNFFTSGGDIDADFRGACARHDMCFESLAPDGNVLECNAQLWSDMQQVCTDVYAPAQPHNLFMCRKTADSYYAAVIAANYERQHA